MPPRYERRISGYKKIERAGKTTHRFEPPDETEDAAIPGVDFDALLAQRAEAQSQLLPVNQVSNLLGRLTRKYYTEVAPKNGTNSISEWQKNEAAVTELLRPVVQEIVKAVQAEGLLTAEVEDVFDLHHLPDVQRAVQEEGMKASELLQFFGAGGVTDAKGGITIDAQILRQEKGRDILLGLLETGGSRNFSLLFHERIHAKQAAHVQMKDRFKQYNKKRTEETRADRSLQQILLSTTLLLLANAQSIEHSPALITVPILILNAIRMIYQEKRSDLSFAADTFDTSALMEVHAYKADGNVQRTDNSTRNILNRLAHFPYPYGLLARYRDRIIAGSQEVERLRALGATHENLAALIGQARWDSERIGYDSLEDEIERRASERGLDLEQVDTLVDARRIERDIRFLRIRKIAQDHILAVCEREQIQNAA